MLQPLLPLLLVFGLEQLAVMMALAVAAAGAVQGTTRPGIL
jgi:hypothetical protein